MLPKHKKRENEKFLNELSEEELEALKHDDLYVAM